MLPLYLLRRLLDLASSPDPQFLARKPQNRNPQRDYNHGLSINRKRRQQPLLRHPRRRLARQEKGNDDPHARDVDEHRPGPLRVRLDNVDVDGDHDTQEAKDHKEISQQQDRPVHVGLPRITKDKAAGNAADEWDDHVGEAEFGFADAFAALGDFGDDSVGDGAGEDA